MRKILKTFFVLIITYVVFLHGFPLAKKIKQNEDSQLVTLYKSKGMEFYSKGNYQKATEMLEKAVSAGASPAEYAVYLHLSYSYLELNNNKQAEYWAKKLVGVYPRDRRRYIDAFIIFHHTQNYRGALYYLQKVFSSSNKQTWNYHQIAESYLNPDKMLTRKLKEPEKALLSGLRQRLSSELNQIPVGTDIEEKEIEKIIQKVYEQYRNQETTAESSVKSLDNPREIVSDIFYFYKYPLVIIWALLFNFLVYRNPLQTYFLYKGDSYFRKNRHEDAVKYYEKLLYFRSGKFAPYDKLKEIYLKLGRTDVIAISAFEKMYKENPEDREVIAALANAYANKEK